MTENPQENAADSQDPVDHSRSGADVSESVDTAESGTAAEGQHSHPEQTKSGEAPVEQVQDDPALTEGRVITPVDEEKDDDD